MLSKQEQMFNKRPFVYEADFSSLHNKIHYSVQIALFPIIYTNIDSTESVI